MLTLIITSVIISSFREVIIISSCSSKDIIKIIENDGWVLIKCRGDHHYFKHPTKPGKVTVPHPVKDLKKYVVDSILKQAGLK
jgi:predicted RNA binding protein YcfA (HicA-like mRNA interferase family)